MKQWNNDINSYIRLNPFYAVDNLYSCSQFDFITSNQKDSIYNLINHLKQYVSDHSRKNQRVAYDLTVLMPEDCILEDFTPKLAKEIFPKNIPWFAYLEEKGKGKYIHYFFVDRPYFPGGKEIPVISKSNVYKNHLGRICKKSDDAILYRKKGEVLRTEFVHFGKKSNFLYNCPFSALIKRFKNALKKTLNLLKTPIDEDVFIHRINYADMDVFERKNAILKNQTIKGVENQLSQIYADMKWGKMLDPETDVGFKKLVHNVRELLHQEYIKYKKYKISLTVYQNYSRLKESLSYLEERANELIMRFIQKYLGA